MLDRYYVAKILFVALLMTLGTGCEHIGLVQRYQHQATAKCEEHHTAEQCGILYYPSCQPSDGGGQNGCHN